MKKKLLVLLIAVIPAWMPNLASAVEIELGDCLKRGDSRPAHLEAGGWGDLIARGLIIIDLSPIAKDNTNCTYILPEIILPAGEGFPFEEWIPV